MFESLRVEQAENETFYPNEFSLSLSPIVLNSHSTNSSPPVARFIVNMLFPWQSCVVHHCSALIQTNHFLLCAAVLQGAENSTNKFGYPISPLTNLILDAIHDHKVFLLRTRISVSSRGKPL